jgi:hypothetical protein
VVAIYELYDVLSQGKVEGECAIAQVGNYSNAPAARVNSVLTTLTGPRVASEAVAERGSAVASGVVER